MRKTRRTYKDSLFRDIFNSEKRLPEIYECLEGASADIHDIRLTTMDEVFFDSEKNDVSFIVKNRHIILLEHQSTVNDNMPLRILWYIAELYRQHVTAKSPYQSKRIDLPAPKFYVFYNGRANMPKQWQLRLSDAFGDTKGAMELIVEVININDAAGNELLDKCAPLKAYSTFVAKVRESVHEGCTLDQAVPRAIQYCIANGYLTEYFTEKQEKEVFDMVSFQWDQELALEVRAEEAREEGMEKGMEKERVFSIRSLMANLQLTAEKAMDALSIPKEEQARYKAML